MGPPGAVANPGSSLAKDDLGFVYRLYRYGVSVIGMTHAPQSTRLLSVADNRQYDSYHYDSVGRRTEDRVFSATGTEPNYTPTTKIGSWRFGFAFEADPTVREYTPANGTSETWTQVFDEIGAPLASIKGDAATGQVYYNVRDLRGSVKLVLNKSANIVARFNYQPFGAASTTVVDDNNLLSRFPYRYAGLQYDDHFKLYVLPDVLYDPGIRRFLAPTALGGDFSPYAFGGRGNALP